MKTLMIISLILNLSVGVCLAQEHKPNSNGLKCSHSTTFNYDYTKELDSVPFDNLALLVHKMHLSLMANLNNDSASKSRPIVFLNDQYVSIENLTTIKSDEVAKIEIEFIPHNQLAALFGTSALNGYGFIKITTQEKN